MRWPKNALFLALGLVPASANAQPANDVLQCVGPFAKDANEADLKKAFGAANVKRVDLDVGEGSTEPGTVVFPNDPKRRIEVLWHDSTKRQRPSSISIKEKSTWTIAAQPPDQRRIMLGTPLAEVEAINGKPIIVYGFGWDMGGFAGGWEGGALGQAVGPCSLSLRFDPDPKAKSGTLDKASGDKPFKSSSPAMRAVKPTVSSISLGWPE